MVTTTGKIESPMAMQQDERIFPPDKFGDVPLPEKAYRDREFRCRHQWRIIENFHEELPRDLSKPRVYAAYCVYCLLSKGVEIKIK